MAPKVGGPYAYVREAFSPFAGFLVGWGLLLAEWFSLAVFPVAFTQYFATLAGERLTIREPVTRTMPFLHGNMTKMKVLLPVGKPRAWKLIATTDGLESWFPWACTGTVAPGETLTFRWADGPSERFRVRRVGDRHSSLALDWRNGAELRFFLHGRLTTLTLEIEYPRGPEGRRDQIREMPLWAFRLSNLKAVAVAGRDLRSKSRMKRRSWTQGFVDG